MPTIFQRDLLLPGPAILLLPQILAAKAGAVVAMISLKLASAPFTFYQNNFNCLQLIYSLYTVCRECLSG